MVKEGKLSVAKKNNKGHNLYDTSELIRVFGEHINEPIVEHAKTQSISTSEHYTEGLEVQLEEAKKQIEFLQSRNVHLEEKNDQLTSEILNISKRLLEAPKEKRGRKTTL